MKTTYVKKCVTIRKDQDEKWKAQGINLSRLLQATLDKKLK